MTIPTDEGFIDQNIEVNHLPRRVDNLLKTLAHLRGMTKKAIVREALVEYVDRHQSEISKLAAGGKRGT